MVHSMKLNELVRLRNQLAGALDSSILNLELEKNCSRLLNLASDIDPVIASSIINLAKDHQDIALLYQRDHEQLTNLLSVIQEQINQLATKFFEEN